MSGLSRTMAATAAMTGICLLASGVAAQTAAPAGPAARAFTPVDLNMLARLSDPQVSPDGRHVAYVLRETDLEGNRGRSDLWLLDLTRDKATPRRLTQHSGNDTSPRWSAGGETIYFLSTRSGSSQIWRLPLAGGEALQVTDYPLEVGSFEVAPRGERLALSLEVFPDCADLKCTRARLDAEDRSKPTGRTYDGLFVRHWDTWKTGTRSNLFVISLAADGRTAPPVNVSKAIAADVPSKPFGGDEDYAFSPDGARLVFAARAAGREEAWSTNFDLYEVAVDGSGTPKNLTAENPAWDAQPVFLKNGDLAWLAMQRPGFEADRFAIRLRTRDGTTRAVAADWDRSLSRLAVARDGRTLLATTDDLGQHPLFAVDPATGKTTRLSRDGYVGDYSPAGRGVIGVRHDLGSPPDLYLLTAGAEPRRLTSVNAARLEGRALGAFEQFSFAGWNGETVHGYVVKPAGFAPGKKYPVAFVVHGGPQVSFQNQWTWRWNAQAFAGRGFGVVFIDFHGSPGYGQAFTDSISQNWGSKPFEDLRKGLAAATEKFDWLDGQRACSLGASYGGYMQNWIAGNWPDGFKCIVNHAGIFDARSMYYTTEELWFTEWENGGPYHAAAEIHERYNPVHHVKNWRTPMLVTHGQQDFRVPYSQGIATFTALQRLGVPSKLVVFPDENHWVLKPANSLYWYGTVLDWLDAHTR